MPFKIPNQVSLDPEMTSYGPMGGWMLVRICMCVCFMFGFQTAISPSLPDVLLSIYKNIFDIRNTVVN
jgi:hypothetical protein